MAVSDTKFVGSIPEKYDAHLGPMLFEPYAADFVRRLALPHGCSVLELACGTGILTRRILAALPEGGRLTATDLNPPMLEKAGSRVGEDPRLQWRTADAMQLPFPDASFDLVASQFGVMFFPDKLAALREASRVLKPGGQLAFSVWDSTRRNSYVEVTEAAVARFFPDNPPTFFHIPFGYHDQGAIRLAMGKAGFSEVRVEEVPFKGTSPSAWNAAIGLVEGCPLIVGIQERGVSDPRPIVQAVASDLAAKFGDAPMQFDMGALWVTGMKR
jgi:ubiquinone/menaquinone biosynthesis C-methylase UbiE